MRILFLSRWYPYPPDNGSKIRIYNLIRQLSTRHEVDLISFYLDALNRERIEAMKACCDRVSTALYHPFQPEGWRSMRGYFSAQPRFLVDTYSHELARQAAEAASSKTYDAVIASQIDMIPYALELPVRVKIFEEIELTSQYEAYSRQKSLLKRARHGLRWKKLCNYLNQTLPGFDGITVVSDEERKRICEIVPRYHSVAVIPNGVDLNYLAGDFGQPEADTLVYNGALTYGANFDAMCYFLGEVFPLIRAQRPGVRLYITGNTQGVRLQDLPTREGVVFTGYLTDIRPRVARSWLSVVPLREGGGTRLKVLESMALGTPVVSTAKGAEGLNVCPGEDILIADGPVGFASAVLRMLDDPGLRLHFSQAGRKTVSTKYSWDKIGEMFIGFLEQAVGDNPHGSD